MEKIASFTVDHRHLFPGLYPSRKDISGKESVTTFDLRMTAPNREPVMDTPAIHTIEHLGATYLRNSAQKDDIVYFGPMGCQTGFYFLFDNEQLIVEDAIDLLKDVFAKAAVYEGEMPGKSAKECGNYVNLDVALARECCRFYADLISDWTVEKLAYPEK